MLENEISFKRKRWHLKHQIIKFKLLILAMQTDSICTHIIKWEIVIVHLNRLPNTKRQRPKGYVKNSFFTCIAPMLRCATEWFHQWRVYEALRQWDQIFIHTQLLYVGRRNQVTFFKQAALFLELAVKAFSKNHISGYA